MYHSNDYILYDDNVWFNEPKKKNINEWKSCQYDKQDQKHYS